MAKVQVTCGIDKSGFYVCVIALRPCYSRQFDHSTLHTTSPLISSLLLFVTCPKGQKNEEPVLVRTMKISVPWLLPDTDINTRAELVTQPVGLLTGIYSRQSSNEVLNDVGPKGTFNQNFFLFPSYLDPTSSFSPFPLTLPEGF